MAQAASREHDVREAAVALLEATKQFDGVYHYSAPEDKGQRAGDLKAAVVMPVNGSESLEWDDVTTGHPLCRMTFNVVVMARNEDPATRDGIADMLMNVARNALNGQSLADLTFPQMTMMTTYVWLPEASAERKIRCVVQCEYEVPGFDAHNTSE